MNTLTPLNIDLISMEAHTMVGPEAMNEAELNLSDLQLLEPLPSKAAEVSSPVTFQSIPAVLCDELLLNEIRDIPDKMAFKIGDVAEILGIKQYVLRYWESEFDVLKPKKASNNQRMYTRKDVENALLIRKLLYRDRFSIEGARHALKELKSHVRKERDINQFVQKIELSHERLREIAEDLHRIRESLLIP